VWGNSDYGGANAPAGRGYTKIYSNTYAFAALAHDGSIKVWGVPHTGGANAPITNLFIIIAGLCGRFSKSQIDISGVNGSE
jgi:hypothetical protein